MGHRHLSNTNPLFEIDQYQNPTNIAGEHSGVPIEGAVVPANGSFIYPMETVTRSRFYGATQQESESRLVGHSSVDNRVGGSHVHAFHSGLSYDSFPHFSGVGSLQATPENDASHSHYNRPIVREVEGGLLDSEVNAGRGPLKRKGSGFERGSTSSRCYDAGSSSNSLELQREKRALDYDNYPSGSLELPHHQHRGGNLSIGCEEPLRNVRRRYRTDLEPHPTRTYLSSYSSHYNPATIHQPNDSGRMDVTYFNHDANAYNQNYIGISPPARERFIPSGTTGLRNEMNRYFAGVSTAQTGGYNNDPISGRVPASSTRYPHNVHAQVTREGHSNHSQGAAPSDSIRSSSSQVEQETAATGYRQRFSSETYSSRFSRPFSARGCRNHRSDARTRRLERFQSFSTAVNGRDRMRTQALLMEDGTNLYRSRNLFDQYGDMRLDIDNMSYEELLALGERIGNVSTGLSENVMSKCLKVTTYSPDKREEDATCSICLEEYKNGEEYGILKCGHGYHVVCIKRWLFMKNACPICKAPAHADTSKERII